MRTELPLLLQGSEVEVIATGTESIINDVADVERGKIIALDARCGAPLNIAGFDTIEISMNGQLLVKNDLQMFYNPINQQWDNEVYERSFKPIWVEGKGGDELEMDFNNTTGVDMAYQLIKYYENPFQDNKSFLLAFNNGTGLKSETVVYSDVNMTNNDTITYRVPKRSGRIIGIRVLSSESTAGGPNAGFEQLIDVRVNGVTIIDGVTSEYFVSAYRRPTVFPICITPGGTIEISSRAVGTTYNSVRPVVFQFIFES